MINASEDAPNNNYEPPNLDGAYTKEELPLLLPEEFNEIVSIPNRLLYDMTRNSDNLKKVKTGNATSA